MGVILPHVSWRQTLQASRLEVQTVVAPELVVVVDCQGIHDHARLFLKLETFCRAEFKILDIWWDRMPS
jgi:hypothetical protein